MPQTLRLVWKAHPLVGASAESDRKMTDTRLESSKDADAYLGYKAVAEIASKAIADGVEDIFRKLRDPDVFRAEFMGIADSVGVSLDSADDVMSFGEAFRKLATGVAGEIRWMNNSGIPERDDAYGESATPAQPDLAVSDGPVAVGLQAHAAALVFGFRFTA
ncbi:hypothetical protein [Streptomyces sp. NBC_01546]|uniref:hypothetical protein n=1 Tax=Streptomyces sp. NBC_01546 TaxID=2975872 RepID=UPI002F91595E